MKYLKLLYSYFLNYFSKVPYYLRGFVIFFIIVGISYFFNFIAIKFQPSKKFYYYEPEFLELENTEGGQVVIKSDLKEDIKVDNNSKQIKGEIKENMKFSPIKKRKKDEVDKSIILNYFESDYIFGSDDAPVTIIEYSSFKCPYCIKFHQDVMEKIKNFYINTGKVKYIKRIIIQKDSLVAVMLPYCANQENKYLLLEELYNKSDEWLKSSRQKKTLKNIALNNGFTEESFNSCVSDEKLANRLLEKQNRDLKELKIYSTPTLFINGQKFTGSMSYKELSELIDSQLQDLNK